MYEQKIAAGKSSKDGWTERLPKWLTFTLQLLSITGIGLTSLGFGATLALRSFGLDVLEMVSGPFDLLRLSAYPVVQIFNTSTAMFGQWWDLAWKSGGVVAAVAASVYAVILALGKDGWLSSLGKRIAAAELWARRVASSLTQRTTFRILRVAVLSFWAFVVLASVAWAPICVMAVASLPAIWGYNAAKAFYHNTIVKPTVCSPLQNAQQRRSEWDSAQAAQKRGAKPPRATDKAECVAYYAKDFGEIRGRLVIATSESVALFDPDSGTAIVLPKRAAMVWSVDHINAFTGPTQQPKP